jgi:Polysulphide reductase, NrfD
VSQQEPNASVSSPNRPDATRSPSERPRVNMVGRADFRSYYGRPILKEPVWTWEIPWYFFFGGMAGASAPLAFAARRAGNDRLARAALTTGAASLAVSPMLLTADLGRPERAHHMLRVFKPTSPMNLGSWLLAAISPALMGSAIADRLDIMPRLARTAEGVAAVFGPGLTTYTAVLLADTAVPVWHEAGRELPFVFASSAAASAGAAACLLSPPGDAGPARRLAVGAAAAELAAATVMERRLGELAEPYRQEPVRRFARLAKGLSVAGALVLGLGGHRRLPAAVGSGLLLAGAACQRHAVVHAGRQSARDPRYVVKPQRERLQAAE